MSKFGDSLDTLAEKGTKLGKELSLKLTLPILAAGTAAVVMATDAETSMRKFGKAFSGAEAESSAALANLTTNYGLAESTAAKLLANTGDLMKGFGASSQQAVDLSEQVQVLAASLAAYNGVPVAQASEAITKALLGETDGLKSLGVAISATAVEQELAKIGMDKAEGSAGMLAKSQAILDLAYGQSADAVSGFSENTDTAAYKMGTLKGSLADLAVSFGEALLPVVKGLIDLVKPMIDGFADLDSNAKVVILVMAALAAAAGPVLVAIGSISTALVAMNATALMGPLGIVAGIGLAVAALAAFGLAAKKAAEEKHADLFEFDASKSLEDNKTKFDNIGIAIKETEDKIVSLTKTATTYSGALALKAQNELLAQQKEDYGILGEMIKKTEESINAAAVATALQTKAEAAAAKEAKIKADTEESYKKTKEAVVNVLKEEQTEQDKIYAQIQVIQKTPWAKGTLETDRKNALEILKDKIVDIANAEVEASKEKLKQNQDELKSNRLTVEDALKKQTSYYATIAASLKSRMKDIEKARDDEINAASKAGGDIDKIKEKYADQETKLRDEMIDTENRRIAFIQSKTDEYYDLQKKQLEQQLADTISSNTKKLNDMKSKGIEADAFKTASINMENSLKEALQDNEKARLAEKTSLDNAYYQAMAENTDDRILQLVLERDKAIAEAEAANLNIDEIRVAYAIKEKELKDAMQEEERVRIAEITKKNLDLYLEIENLQAELNNNEAERNRLAIERIQKERDEAIAAATQSGLDIDAVKLKYKLIEEQYIADVKAREEEKLAAINTKNEELYAAIETIKSTMNNSDESRNQLAIARIQAERDEAIASATQAGLDIDAVKLLYKLKEEQYIADVKAKEEEKLAAITLKNEEMHATIEELKVALDGSDAAKHALAIERIRSERDTRIAEANKAGTDIDAVKEIYKLKEEQYIADVQEKETIKLADIKTKNQNLYDDIESIRVTLDGSDKTRDALAIERIHAQRDAAIADATKSGLDVDAVKLLYKLKEEQYVADIVEKETEKTAKKKELEDSYASKLLSMHATKLEQIKTERDDAIAAAEKIGADTTSINAYYDDLEADAIADELKLQQDKQKSIDDMNTSWQVKINTQHGDLLANLVIERDAAIAAAEKAGADTVAIRQYYADEEARITKELAEKNKSEYEKTFDTIKDGLATITSQSYLNAMTTIGTSLKEGKDGLDAMADGMSNLLDAILDALPNMLLQAGLSVLVANPPLGAALIAASGLVAIGNSSGFFDEAGKWIGDTAGNIGDGIADATKATGDAIAGVGKEIGKFFKGFHFAGGTTFAPGGLSLVGEYGPEYVNLPRGADVIPAGRTRDMIRSNDNDASLPISNAVFRKMGQSIVESIYGSTSKNRTQASTNQTIQIIMDGKVLYNVVNTGLTNRAIKVPSAALV